MAYNPTVTAFDQLSNEDRTRMTAGSAHRVDANVFIGGYLIAAEPKFIRETGITRIVKMFADTDDYPGGRHRHPGVKYLVIDAKDTPEYDIRDGGERAVRFIREGLAANEKILVHCHAGISRSATVVLLHLMVNRSYPLDLALARLRSLRSFVQPNPGFMAHLRATDARLRLLTVGDERRVISPRDAERPYSAPPPVLAGERRR
jgi:predicted protein tyrosine phosphatase